MEKVQEFNHELDNSAEACGLKEDSLRESISKFNSTLEEMIKKDESMPSVSEVAEIAEDSFSPREIALLYSMEYLDGFKDFLVEQLKGRV